MKKEYKADDIKVLEGLEAVRLRPGMYIGTTGIKGLHHILWEIVDNSIDEISNGFGDTIEVTLHKDGSASVEDNGRGIPVDAHPKLGISGVEVVFTKLHAGGKFDNENYRHSGGLHGVGASVTNALSLWLNVDVFKNGTTYRMEFETKKGKDSIKSGIPKGPLKNLNQKTDKSGSLVRFMPDADVFETIVFNFDIISKRLKELAFLNKGLKIKLTDERSDAVLTRDYQYNGGLIDFVKYLNEAKTVAFSEPIFIEGGDDVIKLQLAMQYTDAYTENIFSYVNNIPTTEGGTHETGFKTALTKVMNDVARKNGVLKEKEQNMLGEDFREGLTAILSISMQNIEFEGQTKTKLGNPEVKVSVERIVGDLLTEYFYRSDNKSTTDTILKKAVIAAKVREAARKEKEITRQKHSIENFNLVGKLSSCTGRKPMQNELFIVEGDSAGGTCKQARSRAYQAILPLRGKPLNAEKKRMDQVLLNEEIRTIISALGCGIGEDFDLSGLNYYKVIILSDADQDGAHIRAILLTFFFRYMKELITNGHIYIGMPPLYKIEKKSRIAYVYSDDELNTIRDEFGKSASVQRYKGLGEMNAEQLWDTTMDPKKRALIKVTIDDAAEAEKMVSVLMGDAVEQRRNYIIENADFNKEDNFRQIAERDFESPEIIISKS